MYAQRQQAYAPTPYSYTPTSSLSATINLDEVCASIVGTLQYPLTVVKEVKLASSSSERDLYDSLAEVYSIIVTLEALEKAYLKDSVAATYYTETCGRLLQQYKSNLADDTVSKAFGDLETFKAEWKVGKPRDLSAVAILTEIRPD